MNEESTHFIFDGMQIQISPNISKVFDFLIEIEKESDAVFGVENKLREISDYYRDLLGLTEKLSVVLKENNIEDWSFNLNKDPRNFTEILSYHVPVRTKMILLFTKLEVMYFLYLAYTKEVDSEVELREFAMKDEKLRKTFIRKFLLSEDNDFYKQHIVRLSKLDAGKIIRLRNSLVHFFSLSSDSIGICAEKFSNDARKFEKYAKSKKRGSMVIISPSDLQELIKSAHIILFKRWTNDTLQDNPTFKRKIGFVNNVVSEYGAVAVYYNNQKKI